MKYLLDQTKAYQVLSQIDHQRDYLKQTNGKHIYEEDSSDEGGYESDSSLDNFYDKNCAKVTEKSDKDIMVNYGSYFTEVILFNF